MSAAVPAVLLCRAGAGCAVPVLPAPPPGASAGAADPRSERAEPAAPVPPSVVLIPAPAEPGLAAVYCVYGTLTGLHGPNLLTREGPADFRSDGACPRCKAWWDADRARRRAGAVA